MHHQQYTGKFGEGIAAAYLQQQGYTILYRNWRYRHLEVDIIACLHNRLHFIEVKTRCTLQYGHPEESITKEKMQHLRDAAEAYQYRYPQWQYLQFDVLAITLINKQVKEIFLITDVYF